MNGLSAKPPTRGQRDEGPGAGLRGQRDLWGPQAPGPAQRQPPRTSVSPRRAAAPGRGDCGDGTGSVRAHGHHDEPHRRRVRGCIRSPSCPQAVGCCPWPPPSRPFSPRDVPLPARRGSALPGPGRPPAPLRARRGRAGERGGRGGGYDGRRAAACCPSLLPGPGRAEDPLPGHPLDHCPKPRAAARVGAVHT